MLTKQGKALTILKGLIMVQVGPLVGEIVKSLEELGGIAAYKDLYIRIEERNNIDFTVYKDWKSAIRRDIQHCSSDSKTFLHKKDIFYSVEGIGKGVWGLRSFVKDTPSPTDNPEDQSNEHSLIPKKIEQKTYRYLRDTQIVRALKLLYKDKCQVCGIQLLTAKGTTYSEGHHIRPLNLSGKDEKANILVLCPNHHAEFDYGSIAIDIDTLTVLHIDASNCYAGKKLLIKHTLDMKSIDYHLKNIFGKGNG